MIRLGVKNYNMTLTKKQQKTPALSFRKIDKNEYLTVEEILSSNLRQIIEQATFTYSPSGKVFENRKKNDWRPRRKTYRCY